jgi:hypothetical protein
MHRLLSEIIVGKTTMSKKHRSRRNRKTAQSLGMAARIRVPVEIPKGRKLRVLIYARYSTEEQNPRSIQDQVDFCKKVLAALELTDVEIEEISDEGISGEIASRPGIDQVREGVQDLQWDLILVEDSSRLYRNETACFELVESAVDQRIRVICFHDYVDTADEDWDGRLHDAQRQHSQSNRYTALRIIRAHDGLWDMGAAIGRLLSGYLRKHSIPATEREPAKGPFFDEIAPQWESTIQETFERIAAGASTWQVADWLTSTGLPRISNSSSETWSDKNVIALIGRTTYRGVEERGKTISKKHYRSGRRKQVRNDPENVRSREMPHLRMVSDHLWYAANDAIKKAALAPEPPRGPDHRLYGIPRDSRRPLSKILVCGRCQSGMNVTGPNGHCCSLSEQRTGKTCWNKATAKIDITHAAIRDALLRELTRLEAVPAADWLDAVTTLLGDDGQAGQRQTTLENEIRELETGLQNLYDIAESGKQKEGLAQRIDEREETRDRRIAELEELKRGQQLAEFSHKEFAGHFESIKERILKMERDVQADLKLLVGTIEASPFQQFGSAKVVLRGRFQFHPVGLLPPRLRLALNSRYGDDLSSKLPEWLQPVSFSVDLFQPSAGPSYGIEAERLEREKGLGLTAIGKRLGITKRKANIAVQFGRKLRAAGLTDPFIELTECPQSASRWKIHPPNDESASHDNEPPASNVDPAPA